MNTTALLAAFVLALGAPLPRAIATPQTASAAGGGGGVSRAQLPTQAPANGGVFVTPQPVLDPHPAAIRGAEVTISGTARDAFFVEISGPEGLLTAAVTDERFSAVLPVGSVLGANRINALYFTSVAPTFNLQRSAPRASYVTHDEQAPSLFIDFPADAAQFTTPSVDVLGRVGDMLSGFQGMQVSVNGQPAQVVTGTGNNGTFALLGAPLQLGANAIDVVATDALGNSIQRSISVERVQIPPGAPTLEGLSGNGQSARVNEPLGAPLTVRVLRGDGTPFAGKWVTFRVTRNDGRLALSPGATAGSAELQAQADATGQVSVWWTLGGTAGQGNNRVEVTSTDVLGSTFFCATASPGSADQINVSSGDGQSIETGAIAPEPLRVWVSDSCNGVAGAPVTFTVVRGGGSVDGLASVTVASATTGYAQVSFRAGETAGAQLVEAALNSPSGGSVSFTLRALQRDSNAPTSFRGVVLDNAGRSIGGANCRLELPGRSPLTTISDAQGGFHFADVPVAGPSDLHVDGLTATLLGGQAIPVGSFPALHFEPVLVANTENSLSMPVLLPRLDPANARSYSTTQPTVLTVAGIEGLRMTIAPGSMRLPSGQPAPDGAIVALNQVHHDDVPMPMPDGAAPPFAWTLQPGGAVFDPPIAIEYPNMSGLPPGAIAYFLSFNHDTNRFEIVSSGFVTGDGKSVVSDAGGGLSIAGWGCNCPPYSVTSTCENNEYAYDNSRRFPGCTGQVGCLSAAAIQSGALAGVQLDAIFSGVGQPTTFKLPANGETEVVMAWTDIDMFATTSLGPIHARLKKDDGNAFRSTVTLRSMQPAGGAFFPATLTGVYYFEFDVPSLLTRAFNKEPLVVRSSAPIQSYPPLNTEYRSDGPVPFYDVANPDGAPLFELTLTTVEAQGSDAPIPVTLTLESADATSMTFAGSIRNPFSQPESFRFVCEGSPCSFDDALIVDPPGFPNDVVEGHMATGVVTLSPNEVFDFRVNVLRTGVGYEEIFDLYVVAPAVYAAFGEAHVALSGSANPTPCPPFVGAPLDDSWKVTVAGRSVTPDADGNFEVPNVSAADQFGAAGPGSAPDFVSDDAYRLVGVKSVNGVTQYAFSEPFQLAQGRRFQIGRLTRTNTPPPSPESIAISVDDPTLDAAGQTTNARVSGTLADGSQADLTSRTAWTTYRTSNPAIATVSADGVITAEGDGTALIVASNEGATAVTQVVVSLGDPGTEVAGTAFFEDGSAAVGATAELIGQALAVPVNSDGSFSIPNALAQLSPLQVRVRATTSSGNFSGSSSLVTAVPGGVTDVGVVVLVPVACEFETGLGTPILNCDDCTQLVNFSQGFTFPMLGVTYANVNINSNGNLTFGGGDTTFDPNVPSGVINVRPRISLAFVDFNPSTGGSVQYRQAPDRFVVTWSGVPAFPTQGANTCQVVLFSDGEVHFVYRGMTALGQSIGAGGEIQDISVAISPGGSPSLLSVDYSTEAPFTGGGPSQAVMENFNPTSLLDLDFGCIVWRPSGSGYDVDVFTGIPVALNGLVSGRVEDSSGAPLAGRRVCVTSARDASFAAYAVTDDQGRFAVGGVPAPSAVTARVVDDRALAEFRGSGVLSSAGAQTELVVGLPQVGVK